MLKILPSFTACILLAFATYIGLWFLGQIEGDFPLLLFLASVVTGLYWVAEKLFFLPQRRRAGITQQPWWLDWTAGLFPVIVVVFLLRSFLAEPFKIPSGSMTPTLLEGDMILVNKYAYGIRLPVLNKKVIEVSNPQRGDVMVFRYPPQPTLNYIKRVIGLPGDEISYLNKILSINGVPVSKDPQKDFLDERQTVYYQQFSEKLPRPSGISGMLEHKILNAEVVAAGVEPILAFPNMDKCHYSVEGVTCTVPQGQYFMMGDNRDNSQDSRYWGFVPEDHIVGKAFFVWMHFWDFSRIGSFH